MLRAIRGSRKKNVKTCIFGHIHQKKYILETLFLQRNCENTDQNVEIGGPLKGQKIPKNEFTQASH